MKFLAPSPGGYTIRIRRLANMHLELLPKPIQWEITEALKVLSVSAAKASRGPGAGDEPPPMKSFEAARMRILYTVDPEDELLVVWDVLPA